MDSTLAGEYTRMSTFSLNGKRLVEEVIWPWHKRSGV
jgi:hypothetical protein